MYSTGVGVSAWTKVSKRENFEPGIILIIARDDLYLKVFQLVFDNLVIFLQQMSLVCCVHCKNESFKNAEESVCWLKALSAHENVRRSSTS